MAEWAPEIRENILAKLRDGVPMTKICAASEMPDRETVRRWGKADPDFRAALDEAQEMGYEVMAENAVQEAVDCSDVPKGKLVFDARRWHIERVSARFGNRKVEITGKDGGPVEFRRLASMMTDDELAQIASAGSEAA